MGITFSYAITHSVYFSRDQIIKVTPILLLVQVLNPSLLRKVKGVLGLPKLFKGFVILGGRIRR